MLETKYLIFTEIPNPKKKTKRYIVKNKNNQLLGQIIFLSAWRRYTFVPQPDTVFDSVCLTDILNFLQDVQSMRKSKETKDE